jgi:hypothetical protein
MAALDAQRWLEAQEDIAHAPAALVDAWREAIERDGGTGNLAIFRLRHGIN